MSRLTPVLLALPFLLSSASDSAAARYTGGAVANGGTVHGTVTFKGAKTTKRLKVTKDHGACGQSKASEELIVSKTRLKNAVVYLKGITQGKPARRSTPVIDQQKCVYVPHVLAAVKGSKLELRSSDDVLHNVNGKVKGLTLFNLAMPTKGQRIKRKLRKSGLVKINCDAGHTWMSAFVWVFPHPYFAVTGTDGRFELKDVPAGTYTLEVWHEKLGTRRTRVTVAPGGAVTASLKY